LLPEDVIVLPKHVGAIIKSKRNKYRIQCIFVGYLLLGVCCLYCVLSC
jgi:hypothetical protein